MERSTMDMGDGSDKTVTLIIRGETFEELILVNIDAMNAAVAAIGNAMLPAARALIALGDKWGEQWAYRAFGQPHADPKIAYRMHRRADRQRAKREKYS